MGTRAPFLVGLVLLVASGALTYFLMLTSKDKFSDITTRVVYADFTDAYGLRWKTRLQINGIDVGKIESIEHVRNPQGQLFARVQLKVLKKYKLYRNASVRKAAESLLGDFRLDLDPGTPSAPELMDGEVIQSVQSVSDLDEIQSQLRVVAGNLADITDSVSAVLSGEEGRGTLKAILNRVDRSMGSIERFAEAMAETTGDGGDVKTITENVAQFSSRLDKLALTLQAILDGEQGAAAARAQGVADDRKTVRTAVEGINESIERLNSVIAKVDNGEGTVGRLVNDPGIADKLERTLEDTGELIAPISRLQTEVELRTEYGVPFRSSDALDPGIKNYVGVRLRPKPDKFYWLEAVADPRGSQSRSVTTTGTGTTATREDKTVVSFNKLKFSAQMGKRYYFTTLRFGITESTGGLGLDLHFLDDQLEFRFDAFNFDRRDPDTNNFILPRLRGFVMYEVMQHLYAHVGVDDPLNPDLSTWFLGAVLRFTDDDLRSLLLVAPTPSG